MPISHVKSDTIGDMTGTVTVMNSVGSTATVAATDLIRPSDWNSAHNQYLTLSGNTAGQSTISGTNIVLQGGDNITLSATTAAGAASAAAYAPASATAAQLADKTHAINTTGKFIGKLCVDSTNSKLYWAIAATDVGKWRPMNDQTGAGDITPV